MVSCNMIMRDVEDSIIPALDSTKAIFDEYIFVDTGSKDKTKDLVEKWCNDKKVDYKIIDYKGYKFSNKDKRKREDWGDIPQFRWNFGDARQIALTETSNKAEWFFWLDTDDVLENVEALDSIIEDAVLRGAHIVNMPYHYARDQYGNDVVLHYRERLIRLIDEDGKHIKAEWKDPVHEYLWTPKDIRKKVMVADAIHFIHERTLDQVKRTNRRNNRILYYQLEQAEKPDARLLSNLAFDHYEHREWEESIKYYERLFDLIDNKEYPYIQLYSSYHKYARACIAVKKFDKANDILERMMSIDPKNPDAYLEKAKIYFEQKQFDTCLKFLDLAQSRKQPKTMLPVNSLDYTVKPLLMRAEIAGMQGRLTDAIQHVSQALRHTPGDPQLIEKRRQLIYSLSSKDAFEAVFKMREELYNTGEVDKLVHLIGSIPRSVLGKESIQEVMKELEGEYKYYKKRRSVKLKDKKDIGIYVGRAYERWTPETVKKTGIGGSEEMCIYMADALQKLGNDVTVYNHCGVLEGNYDGVEYVDYRNFDYEKEHDVLIIERVPQMFQNRLKGKRQYLWLHDTQYGELPKKMFTMADRVFVLSEAHKQVLQDFYHLPEDVYWLTRNGVRLDHIEKGRKRAGKRNPYGLMYASSYDRGLDFLLDIFPEIKKQVPEATLDVFYGWNTYKKRMEMLLKQGNPEGKKLKMLYDKINKGLKQEGVNHHGRVNQITLTQKHFENSIWLYPTEFYEISCITAMRSQLCGTVPVCSDYAALSETVEWGHKAPMPRDPKAFIDTTVDLLQNQDSLEKEREIMMENAPAAFDIKSLAKEWDKFFEKDIG